MTFAQLEFTGAATIDTQALKASVTRVWALNQAVSIDILRV
jgi:hypothetical protein